MTFKSLSSKMNILGLVVVREREGGLFSVAPKGIANKMLFFNVNIPASAYNGNVTVKAINVNLFTAQRLHKALILVDEFLQTPMESRGLSTEDRHNS